MTYFPDLSPYRVRQEPSPSTLNVGWLDAAVPFNVAQPSEQLLERLWQFCLISVWQSRGMDLCPFCAREELRYSERGGVKLSLGCAETRVFDSTGLAFAAPNLIYHYVELHHYAPPAQFLQALEMGPDPTTAEYRQLLNNAGVPWVATPHEEGELEIFRFVKRGDEIVREWIKKTKDAKE